MTEANFTIYKQQTIQYAFIRRCVSLTAAAVVDAVALERSDATSAFNFRREHIFRLGSLLPMQFRCKITQ